MDALRGWFAGLTPREQRIVLVALAVAVLVLLLGALLPLERKVGAAQQRVSTRQSDLAWIRSVAPRLATLRGSAAQGSGESLVVLADRAARSAGIGRALTNSQAAGDGSLTLRLEQVPFDSLVAWMASLQQQHGVHISASTIDRTATAGVVSATVILRSR